MPDSHASSNRFGVKTSAAGYKPLAHGVRRVGFDIKAVRIVAKNRIANVESIRVEFTQPRDNALHPGDVARGGQVARKDSIEAAEPAVGIEGCRHIAEQRGLKGLACETPMPDVVRQHNGRQHCDFESCLLQRGNHSGEANRSVGDVR